MAHSRTHMLAAVKGALTWRLTREDSEPLVNPIFRIRGCHILQTRYTLLDLVASNALADFTAVATPFDRNFAVSADALVTRTLANVATTWHEIAACLSTAPSGVIIGVSTVVRERHHSAIAGLCRTLLRAWRTWAGMTDFIARMRTRLLSGARLAACLAARRWWTAWKLARLQLFLAPAGIVYRHVLFW